MISYMLNHPIQMLFAIPVCAVSLLGAFMSLWCLGMLLLLGARAAFQSIRSDPKQFWMDVKKFWDHLRWEFDQARENGAFWVMGVATLLGLLGWAFGWTNYEPL